MNFESIACEKECVFQRDSMSFTTAMYFPPVYDKHGKNTNPDGNTTTGYINCAVCGKRWSYSTQVGKTKFTEIKND